MGLQSTIEKYCPLVYLFKCAIGYVQIRRSPMMYIKNGKSINCLKSK